MNTIFGIINGKIKQCVESEWQPSQLDQMKIKQSLYQQFLHHHLQNQESRTSKPQPQYIRYRQIIQHAELMKVSQTPKHQFILNLLKKVWMKKLFSNFLEEMKNQYDKSDQKISNLKIQVADRYLFELYQLKQFLIAGSLKKASIFKTSNHIQQIKLSSIMMLSDQILYQILEKKADQINLYHAKETLYQQPTRLKEVKQKYDLLQAFPSKSLAYIRDGNKSLIYDDLKYLLNEAIDQQSNFQADMKYMFGQSILCGIKVKKINGMFDVIGLRRILAKWVQNLIETDPQLVYSKAFHNFIKNKTLIFDNFHINQGSETSTHQKIIDILLQLLISSVFQGKYYNNEFGLFIYDLLRSKIVVSSIQEIENLVLRLQTQKNTKKPIKIFRLKNRLNTHNRDVLINFNYGQILAAEIQIGLGHQGTPEQINLKKKKYQYKHFLYELSRSIFGPTMELIILYQDHYRKDISAKMYAVGQLSKNQSKFVYGIESTKLKCPSGHQLLLIKQEIFNLKKQLLCRSCFKMVCSNETYLYCYHCTLFYCNQCKKKFNSQKLASVIIRKNIFVNINSIRQFKEIKGYKLLFFHLSYSPASNLMMQYLKVFDLFQNNQSMKFYIVNIEQNKQFQDQADILKIVRFPTFVLYENNKSLKVLVGASIYKLYQMITIINTKSLIKKCPQDHDLIKCLPAEFVYWKCNQCLRQKSSNQQQILCCKACLYFCCRQCGFIQNQIPKYQDSKGYSYLSTPLTLQSQISNKLQKYCKNRHSISFIRNNNDKINIAKTCSKCKKKFFFIRQYGMSECKPCGEIYCNMCIGIVINIISNNQQLANHPLLITAFDIPKCHICFNHYKKTYFTQNMKRNWQCIMCFNSYQNKILHLMCYKCQKDVCLKCSKNLKNNEQQLVYKNFCKCSGDLQLENQLVNTSEIFKCTKCRKKYYINTKKYVCQQQKCPYIKKYFNHYQIKYVKAHYCFKCVIQIQKMKKHKFKIVCIKEGEKLSYRINEIQQEWAISETLESIQKKLKQLKFIKENCEGRFKIQKQEFSQDIQKKIQVRFLTEYKVIYYFESISVEEILTQILKMSQLGFRRSNSSSIYENLKQINRQSNNLGQSQTHSVIINSQLSSIKQSPQQLQTIKKNNYKQEIKQDNSLIGALLNNGHQYKKQGVLNGNTELSFNISNTNKILNSGIGQSLAFNLIQRFIKNNSLQKNKEVQKLDRNNKIQKVKSINKIQKVEQYQILSETNTLKKQQQIKQIKQMFLEGNPNQNPNCNNCSIF